MSAALFDGIDVDYLAKSDYAKTGLHWTVFLPAGELLAAVTALYKAEYTLEDITAIDAKEGYLVTYRFENMAAPERTALRVLVPHDAAELPSIASVFQGAEWHERETFDFYGIVFPGNPNPVPLVLPHDMTEHPLQKAEGARVSLVDMIPPGEMVRSSPRFTLYAPPPAEGGETASV
ncbi:MAG: NADH-quinone oxidoreductase subunit C [Rhodospirillaceae bacterium]|nr:NADH-quinone oxidoreductase subunit C [Rhodospirillaceae bacterium]